MKITNINNNIAGLWKIKKDNFTNPNLYFTSTPYQNDSFEQANIKKVYDKKTNKVKTIFEYKDGFLKTTKNYNSKTGEFKNFTEYNPDGSIYRKGKITNNKYSKYVLSVDYPNSSNNLKEIYVWNNYENYSYKLTKENVNDKQVLITNYLTHFEHTEPDGIPNTDDKTKRFEIYVNKYSRKTDKCTLYSGKSYYTYDFTRDNKGRMIKKVFQSKNENRETLVKYSGTKVFYDVKGNYFDETYFADTKNGENKFYRKFSNPKINSELIYIEGEKLTYLQKTNGKIVRECKGDPDTFELIYDKEYDNKGNLESICELKDGNYQTTIIEDGIPIIEDSTTLPTFDFNTEMDLPNETNILHGMISSYKINEIYPIKY